MWPASLAYSQALLKSFPPFWITVSWVLTDCTVTAQKMTDDWCTESINTNVRTGVFTDCSHYLTYCCLLLPGNQIVQTRYFSWGFSAWQNCSRSFSRNPVKTKLSHQMPSPCHFNSCQRSSLWEFSIWSLQLEAQLNSNFKQTTNSGFCSCFCSCLFFFFFFLIDWISTHRSCSTGGYTFDSKSSWWPIRAAPQLDFAFQPYSCKTLAEESDVSTYNWFLI